jgi:hypothetical protein
MPNPKKQGHKEVDIRSAVQEIRHLLYKLDAGDNISSRFAAKSLHAFLTALMHYNWLAPPIFILFIFLWKPRENCEL